MDISCRTYVVETRKDMWNDDSDYSSHPCFLGIISLTSTIHYDVLRYKCSFFLKEVQTAKFRKRIGFVLRFSILNGDYVSFDSIQLYLKPSSHVQYKLQSTRKSLLTAVEFVNDALVNKYSTEYFFEVDETLVKQCVDARALCCTCIVGTTEVECKLNKVDMGFLQGFYHCRYDAEFRLPHHRRVVRQLSPAQSFSIRRFLRRFILGTDISFD